MNKLTPYAVLALAALMVLVCSWVGQSLTASGLAARYEEGYQDGYAVGYCRALNLTPAIVSSKRVYVGGESSTPVPSEGDK